MSSQKVRYNDHLFVLLVVPVIAGINYYLTYSRIEPNWFLVFTFVLDTLEGYCAWYAARAVIIWLDAKLPWSDRAALRLVIQIPFVAVVVIVILSVLTELVNAIVRDQPVNVSFYRYDILIFAIWSLLIDSVYAVFYFYQLSTPRKGKDFIISKTGSAQKVIYLKDIRLFYVDNQVTFACTNDARYVLPDYTLEKVEKSVDNTFYRANRQFVITRKIVDRVVRDKEGKLSVFLIPGPDQPTQLTISRLKAAAFKDWFSSAPQ